MAKLQKLALLGLTALIPAHTLTVFEQYGGHSLTPSYPYIYNHSRLHSKSLPITIYHSDPQQYIFFHYPKGCTIKLINCTLGETFEWPMNGAPSNKVGIEGIQKFFRDFQHLGARLLTKNRLDASSIDYSFRYNSKIYYISQSGANGEVDLTIRWVP